MDGLSTIVREQVALGRLLPLGGSDDPLWITEAAAADVLRRADVPPGVRLGPVAILLDGPAGAVPGAAPPGALPHGPLRIEADLETTADIPLPLVAERLREALWDQARQVLGAAVTAVDLTITGILEIPAGTGPSGAGDDAAADRTPLQEPDPAAYGEPAAGVAAAVCAVPGVHGVTRRLGTLPGVRVTDPEPGEPADAPGERRVQVQIAIAPGRPPLPVARAAALAAGAAAATGAPGPVSAAVLVTDVL